MFFSLFGTNRIATAGAQLADKYSALVAMGSSRPQRTKKFGPREILHEVLTQARRQAVPLQLNFYRKARLANAFKWRLIENGVKKEEADELTQNLILQLSFPAGGGTEDHSDKDSPSPDAPKSIKALIAQADACVKRQAFDEALQLYGQILEVDPRHAQAINNVGACHCQLDHYREAEGYFRRAIKVDSKYVDAYSNLAAVLRGFGQLAESESCLRRALRLKPSNASARVSLGLTLLARGRAMEAKGNLEKALRALPKNTDALTGLGQVAITLGDFSGAEQWFQRALDVNPNLPRPWAALANLRKMTSEDGDWSKRAQQIIATGLTSMDESSLRFALGKYHDDIGKYDLAFENYKRGNDILKSVARPYDSTAHKKFVDDLIATYSTHSATPTDFVPGSNSERPVLVAGMMRSGTSLVEQIIASHPKAAGAGELEFWATAVHRHEANIRNGAIDQQTKMQIAKSYLETLSGFSTEASRIVDKAPINSDFLGIIHSIFPNARMIYMQRNPMDTCLSCYFQEFLPVMNFTMDLSDLANYYEQHARLIDHWKKVLPPDALLIVPYEELVADPEAWIRRILQFLGLEWSDHCLQFQNTQRSVSTASAWQVRQRIYKRSVERWRHYEKFLGPLRHLASDPTIHVTY